MMISYCSRSINPTTESRRTDPRLYQIFTTWFAANANILTFGAGSVGPAAFGLGMKDSFLTIIVTDIMYVSGLFTPAWVTSS